MDGEVDGDSVGVTLGDAEGCGEVGSNVGLGVSGCFVGSDVGAAEGDNEGPAEPLGLGPVAGGLDRVEDGCSCRLGQQVGIAERPADRGGRYTGGTRHVLDLRRASGRGGCGGLFCAHVDIYSLTGARCLSLLCNRLQNTSGLNLGQCNRLRVACGAYQQKEMAS